MKKNFRLTIEYDGTKYSGWEAKPTTPLTIQGKITEVLIRLNPTVKIIGAGRTDAGVHANGMVANVHLDISLSPIELLTYMNKNLPEDIKVTDICIVNNEFHSRYDASGKIYRYACYVGDCKPVFDRKYIYCLNKELNLELINEACKHLIGTHDFRSFCGNSKDKTNTTRTIKNITVTKENDRVYFTYEGDGFLQYMVRILTGTLIEVGLGRIKPKEIPAILERKDRSLAGFTAPACGLTLMKIIYN